MIRDGLRRYLTPPRYLRVRPLTEFGIRQEHLHYLLDVRIRPRLGTVGVFAGGEDDTVEVGAGGNNRLNFIVSRRWKPEM